MYLSSLDYLSRASSRSIKTSSALSLSLSEVREREGEGTNDAENCVVFSPLSPLSLVKQSHELPHNLNRD